MQKEKTELFIVHIKYLCPMMFVGPQFVNTTFTTLDIFNLSWGINE